METYNTRIERVESELEDLRQASVLQGQLLEEYRVHIRVLRNKVSALERSIHDAGWRAEVHGDKPGVDVDQHKGRGNYAAMKNP
jgi:hypothetical protein